MQHCHGAEQLTWQKGESHTRHKVVRISSHPATFLSAACGATTFGDNEADLAGGGDAAVGALPGGRRLLPGQHWGDLQVVRCDRRPVVIGRRAPAYQYAGAG